MRKPAFHIQNNKGADQLCGNHAADQHFYFSYSPFGQTTISIFSRTWEHWGALA